MDEQPIILRETGTPVKTDFAAYNQLFEAKQVNVTAGDIFFDPEGNLYVPDLSKPLNKSCKPGEVEPAYWNTSIEDILTAEK